MRLVEESKHHNNVLSRVKVQIFPIIKNAAGVIQHVQSFGHHIVRYIVVIVFLKYLGQILPSK